MSKETQMPHLLLLSELIAVLLANDPDSFKRSLAPGDELLTRRGIKQPE